MILKIEDGIAFTMGKGKNWRVVHPEMGSQEITMNYALHLPGVEFTQHIHEYSEDVIIILEGEGSIRQGDKYTSIKKDEIIFIPAGEVHGTVNTSNGLLRMVSFQSPPDMALYRGEKDKNVKAIPRPTKGHRSEVVILTLQKGSPIFIDEFEWRSVVCKNIGAKHLGVDYIVIKKGKHFETDKAKKEEIYFIINGSGIVKIGNNSESIKNNNLLYLKSGEKFTLESNSSEISLIRAYVL